MHQTACAPLQPLVIVSFAGRRGNDEIRRPSPLQSDLVLALTGQLIVAQG
jgi:hypothetical protein